LTCPRRSWRKQTIPPKDLLLLPRIPQPSLLQVYFVFCKRFQCPLTHINKQAFKIYSRYYLIAYNVLSALGWLYILSLTITHLTNLDGSQSSVIPEKAREATSTFSRFLTSLPFLKSSPVLTTTALESKVPPILRPFYRRATTAFVRVGWPVTLVQSFAVLEVLHVAAKLVKSSLPTTAVQVASRIYLTWGILLRFPSVRTLSPYSAKSTC
jgi:very-long-chain (3R)-3-hydroxyacyl-CoA dehydratase